MSTDPKILRQRIMKRVQALLAKRIENGATEQEALSSAALAARLMADHDLTMLDVESHEDNPIGAMENNLGKLHDVRFCMAGIEALTGTKYYRCGALFTFFGRKLDTQVASSMMIMLKNAMDGEWAKYKQTPEYMRQSLEIAPVTIRSALGISLTGVRPSLTQAFLIRAAVSSTSSFTRAPPLICLRATSHRWKPANDFPHSRHR